MATHRHNRCPSHISVEGTPLCERPSSNFLQQSTQRLASPALGTDLVTLERCAKFMEYTVLAQRTIHVKHMVLFHNAMTVLDFQLQRLCRSACTMASRCMA